MKVEGLKPPLIAIVGPTAVGKTEISLQLAERLNGEIISSDSRLFYRGMDIGTAKPSREEMARVPHHLINVSAPDETWSLGRFQRAAAEIITDITTRGKLPFLVGGTGQYYRAVTEGWRPPEVQPDERLRRVLESWKEEKGEKWLHEKLTLLDPQAAAKIDYRNVRRTIRALEVILTTGRKFSTQRRRSPSPYALLTIGLRRPRTELYERVDMRIEKMFADGLLEETRRLLDSGYSPKLPSMSAIGYRECAAVLNGDMTQAEAIAQMKRITRVFVRRQANWFKAADAGILWFEAGAPRVFRQIEKTIRNWLEVKGV